ncbi:MAG: hypothetical protein FWH06_05935 [Oscillospiraceae bacterium]|nr:hypothetical protein [Oscillospiraceae bacterium]
MEHRIAAYLSGGAGGETEAQIENEILSDTGLLERFIAANERALQAAPPGFADMVMRGVGARPPVTVPVLNRRLCAAVCFCSAAAIALFTITGRQFLDFFTNHYGRLAEILSALNFQ